MNSNGGAGGRDGKTPEEKHRAHVAEMDKLRAREEVCTLFIDDFKSEEFKLILGRNFECSSASKRII